MGLTKEQSKKNIAILVEKYQRVVQDDKVKEYNEEATKTAFIQPLLKDVLGWDVNDFDEVSPEERISRGRVDYCLKIDGKPKIFIEAKPLKADLSKHIEQAVKYGYNRKGVSFVMLTDFEGIKLFDVTIKPDIRNPSKGLKLNLFWNFYESQFNTLWQLSKESVANGELDKLLLAKPKDRISVDKAILNDLKEWREALAKDIYKNNPHLFQPTTDMSLRRNEVTEATSSSAKHEIARVQNGQRKDTSERDAEYLKEITQRILDRIIFMRFCEDRQFVHRRQLKELFDERTDSFGLKTMVILAEEFKHYNIIFNSDLFSPKEWEKDLQIDFKVMNKIVMDTYNPYQFDVIPLEVLGNIYEQYLGYTIRLTPQQVKYELKPDVRKAGGVYYTPEYIVDYIVKNTVGKILSSLSLRGAKSETLNLIQGKSPTKKIKNLRILDPACGSGSFLIRAYEEMLNYYREQKKKIKPQVDTDKHRFKNIGQGNVGQGFSLANSSDLSLRGAERRGNLQLESKQNELGIQYQDSEIRLTILEKAEILKNHIFGVDIDEQAVEVTKLSLMLKMLEGEFGIIPGRNILPMLDKNIRCGNSLISGSPLELKKYFGDDYYKVKPFNWEEEFKEVFADGGFDVVIGNPPYVNLSNIEDENIREYLKSEFKTAKNKSDLYSFFTEKAISVLRKKGHLGYIFPNSWLGTDSFSKFREYIINETNVYKLVKLPSGVFQDATVTTILLFLIKEKVNKSDIELFEYVNNEFLHMGRTLSYKRIKESTGYCFSFNIELKLNIDTIRLGNIAKFSLGVKTSNDARFIMDYKKDKETYKLLRGKDVSRYNFIYKDKWLWYKPNMMMEKVGAGPRKKEYFTSYKIMFRTITGGEILATYDNERYFTNDKVHVLYDVEKYSLKFILGIVNSKLIDRWIHSNFNDLLEIKINQLQEIPIPKIDVEINKNKKLHDNLVALVDVMLDLNKKIQSAKGSAKDQIQREIDKTDKEIDNIVYKLYGITEGERKIIER